MTPLGVHTVQLIVSHGTFLLHKQFTSGIPDGLKPFFEKKHVVSAFESEVRGTNELNKHQ